MLIRLLLIYKVFWSGTGNLVAICAEDSYYVLRFDRDAYNAKLEESADLGDEGVEEAFELIAEISEKSVYESLVYCSHTHGYLFFS